MRAETEQHRRQEHAVFNRYAKLNQIHTYQHTPEMHPYDVKFRSGNTYAAAEVKLRKYPLSFFEFRPPYLEYIKIEGIEHELTKTQQTKGVNVQPYFFHCTADGFLQIFSLSALTAYTYVNRYLPIDDRTPWVKVWKQVAEITEQPTQLIDLRRK